MKRKNASIEDVIEVIKKLYNLGILVNEIKCTDTLQDICKKYNISQQELGIDERFNTIGNKIYRLKTSFRDIKTTKKKPNIEQVEELQRIGISFEEDNYVQNIIHRLEILRINGISVSKIVSQSTLLDLALLSGRDEAFIRKLNMDPLYPIGAKIAYIKKIYKERKLHINTEQLFILKSYGIKMLKNLNINEKEENKTKKRQYTVPKRKIDSVATFIQIIRELKAVGIDTYYISPNDTYGSLAKRSGVDVSVLEGLNLEPGYHIGNIINVISQVHRGTRTNNRFKPTLLDIKILESFGVIIDNRGTKEPAYIKKFILKMKLLKEQGIQVSKISDKDTIASLIIKSGKMVEDINLGELSPFELIGNTYKNIKKAMRGDIHFRKPSQQQLEILSGYGIIVNGKNHIFGEEKNKKVHKKGKKIEVKPIILPEDKQNDELNESQMEIKYNISTVQKFIDILRLLDMNGIDVSRMEDEDTFKTLANKTGKNVEFLVEMDIDPRYRIGKIKNQIVMAYQQGKKQTEELFPTFDEKMTIELYGIDFDESKYVSNFIKKLILLRENDINISRLKKKDTFKNLAMRSGKDEKLLLGLGLNPEEPIGETFESIKIAIRNNTNFLKPSHKQLVILQSMGIKIDEKSKYKSIRQKDKISHITLAELSGKDLGKAGFGSEIELCDEANRDLKQRVEEKNLDSNA